MVEIHRISLLNAALPPGYALQASARCNLTALRTLKLTEYLKIVSAETHVFYEWLASRTLVQRV
jgi:hypothetical protein